MKQSMRRLLSGTAGPLALLLGASGGHADGPELIVGDGSGGPGSSAAVVIRLAGDTGNTGVSADLDIRMPTQLVAFDLPVHGNCAVAERLAATHQIGGTIHQPGVLTLALFARALVVAPFGDGDLATCNFRVLPGADHTTATLAIEFAGLGSARGVELPVVGIDGVIAITGDAPVPPAAQCAGDCDGNGTITVDELVRGVQIVLGTLPATACPSIDKRGTGQVVVSDMVNAVTGGLGGCAPVH